MTSAPAPVGPAEHEVALTITRDPSLVRTVRLVAASIARRAGLDASAVEEVRLAVGETCAVMVGVAPEPDAEPEAVPSASEDQVTVTLRVDGGLVAEISGPSAAQVDDTPEGLGDLADLVVDPWILVRGLREDVEVLEDGASTRVLLTWAV